MKTKQHGWRAPRLRARLHEYLLVLMNTLCVIGLVNMNTHLSGVHVLMSMNTHLPEYS